MEFTTQNGGKSVVINEASFKDAVELKKAVVKCLLKTGIDINNLQKIDASNLFSTLFELIINVDTSDEFDKAVMNCLSNCLYGCNKINENLFNDKPEAREDYYELVTKCCEVNLRPFFKSLVSELKTRFQTLKIESPEQESPQA